MNTIILKFNYTKKEYVNAARKHLIASKIISKPSIILLPLFTLFSIWQIISTSFSTFSLIILTISFLATLMMGILYFYNPIKVFNQTKKLQTEYYLEFSQDNIKFKTIGIDSVLKWNTYSEIWENNNFYYLIQNKHLYTIIPKRVFNNTIELENFEKIILSNFNKIKKV